MNIEEFVEKLRSINQANPGTNTFYSPVRENAVKNWRNGHTGFGLPGDLIQLLRISNGLGIAQQWFEGEPLFPDGWGAYRIYPLEELKRLDLDMYGKKEFSGQFKRLQSFGCGPDSNVYFAFDVKTLDFFHLNPIVPDEAVNVGPRINAILGEIASWAEV